MTTQTIPDAIRDLMQADVCIEGARELLGKLDGSERAVYADYLEKLAALISEAFEEVR